MAALVLAAAMASAPALAADPSINDIYQAAEAGHLDQAQQMIEQVLKDHPESYKAHYVQAELYARENKPAQAREELARAEQINPSLSGFSERSVHELKQELGLLPRSGARAVVPQGAYEGVRAAPAAHFPWGTVMVLGIVVLVFWGLFRRRRTAVSYPAGAVPGAGAPGAYGPGGYVGPGGGGYVGPGGGGIGSNIAGGLAGGLAAGAGIVAGEELAHHFLDGGERGGVVPPANAGEWNNDTPNPDMGGNDFGANDAGSWDDGGGADFGGGGGGDDWT
jgi:hypothetical protein